MKPFTTLSLLIVVSGLLTIAGDATAQMEAGDHDRGHGPPNAEMRVAHMTNLLDLSDEQSAELLAVMQAADQQREALHKKIMLQMEPEICAIQISVESDLKGILDADQLATLETMKAEGGPKRGGRGWRGAHQMDCSAYE